MKKAWVDFKKVKEAVGFEPVLDRYHVKLKSSQGRELVGHCPFHDDKNPSFHVNTEKQVFYCFGCSSKGNALDFVSRKEAVSIREAAFLLSEWFDIREGVVDDSGGNQRPKKGNTDTLVSQPTIKTSREEEKTAPERPEQRNRPLTFRLTLDQGHPYLTQRGLEAHVVDFFGLGYCKRGLMKNRIAIPIHDEKGELVAYAGRWPGDELPEGEGKYKLPVGFRKSQVLFNLHRVKAAERVVIVEGYWSVFRLHQLDIPAVALMGRTLSEAQKALLIASRIRCLTLLLDGDEPGRRGQREILPRLARHFFTRVVDLPKGSQPDTIEEQLLLELLN